MNVATRIDIVEEKKSSPPEAVESPSEPSSPSKRVKAKRSKTKPKPVKTRRQGSRLPHDEELFAKTAKGILDRVKKGLSYAMAARATQVSPRTERGWYMLGKAAAKKRAAGGALSPVELRYEKYARERRNALAVCVDFYVTAVANMAVEGNMQAAAFMLTRQRQIGKMFQEPAKRLEHSGKIQLGPTIFIPPERVDEGDDGSGSEG